MTKSGIYAIVNCKNGHRYIGSSNDISRRWNDHRSALRRGNHHNIYLQRAWLKHGEDNFVLMILFQCTGEECHVREQEFIDNLKPQYNISPQANGGSYPGINKGRKRPDTSERNRLHKTRGHTGMKHSPEAKHKMSLAWEKRRLRGSMPEDVRLRIGQSARGRKMSKEAREKISLAMKIIWAERSKGWKSVTEI